MHHIILLNKEYKAAASHQMTKILTLSVSTLAFCLFFFASLCYSSIRLPLCHCLSLFFVSLGSVQYEIHSTSLVVSRIWPVGSVQYEIHSTSLVVSRIWPAGGPCLGASPYEGPSFKTICHGRTSHTERDTCLSKRL